MKARTAGGGPAAGTAPVAAAFQQAVLLQLQGRPFQADALCAEVLRAEPKHFGAWHLRALLALEGGNVEQGIEWLRRSLELQPNQHAAHSNLGNALLSQGRFEEALASLERALRLQPDYVLALYNRGNAQRELRRFKEALVSYDRVLQLQPNHVAMLNNRALVLLELGQVEGALSSLQRAVEIDPHYKDATRNLAIAWCARGASLLERKRLEDALASYTQAVQVDPGYSEGFIKRGDVLQLLRQKPERDYVLGSLFHARLDACDWTDYDASVSRLQKVLAAAKQAVNPFTLLLLPNSPEVPLVTTRSHTQAQYPPGLFEPEKAERRPKVLAGRRIRVAYVSPDFRDHPVSYLMAGVLEQHDREAFEVGPKPGRESVGLPESGLVLCCINNNYKINPPVFDTWMRLLREVPDSVLWLLADREGTQQNLRREAVARGVDAARLVFAARMPYVQHLGRLGLADLFLDTLPYNAGATASDALRVGVPVLTCSGKVFSSRMAGSLLRAVGLPELITLSPEEYERKGLELAREPQQLRALRERLAENLPRSPLFDTPRFCRHLEAAYRNMHEQAARGRTDE